MKKENIIENDEYIVEDLDLCVGIYAVLIQNITFSGDIAASLWSVTGYTILLCFTLFKTGSIAKSVLHAH